MIVTIPAYTFSVPDPIPPAVIDMAALAAAVAKLLAPPAVTPPVVVPPAGTAPVLKVVIAQNGHSPWPQDYSYSAVITKDYPGGNGNAKCIQVVAGLWGGYQPSNNNGIVTDFSQCSRITVDVSAPKGWQGSVQFLRGGDLPIAGTKNNHFTKTKDGWETLTFSKADVMTDNVLGDVSSIIYKGAVESQNNQASSTYMVDNWGGI